MDIWGYMIGVGLGEFWQDAGQDELYEEYSLWLETHGLHDEEEPPEDTFVGYVQVEDALGILQWEEVYL